MKKYTNVALGGTFDIIHKGHMELLKKAFEISTHVIIGLVGDQMAQQNGKSPKLYEKRYDNLVDIITETWSDISYDISMLKDTFGPTVLSGDVQALIVSGETRSVGDQLNNLRQQRGLSKVEIITVPMVLADDGKRISTSRIHDLEIDESGHIL